MNDDRRRVRGPFDTPGTPPSLPPTPQQPAPAPVPAAALTPEQLAAMPNYSGILFDPQTGKTYREDGTDTGFTFERSRWTGPFGISFSWPWLNPISFATAETAQQVLEWAKSFIALQAEVTIDDTQNILGPFTRTIERRIVVRDANGKDAEFSAGWLANSIIRNGKRQAAIHWRAELNNVNGADLWVPIPEPMLPPR